MILATDKILAAHKRVYLAIAAKASSYFGTIATTTNTAYVALLARNRIPYLSANTNTITSLNSCNTQADKKFQSCTRPAATS